MVMAWRRAAYAGKMVDEVISGGANRPRPLGGSNVMPAPLFPHADIPDLAQQVTPEQREVLTAIQRAGFIRDHELHGTRVALLNQLTSLGLVDPAHEGSTNGPVHLWTSNGNGQRALRYLTGIRSGPHFEVAADTLASWLEDQGEDRWWAVDGDPLLTGRLDFPCPADELAAEIRKIGKPLLVQAKKGVNAATGQLIDKGGLDTVAGKVADGLHLVREGSPPPWLDDRILYLCWKGSTNDWLLSEDSEARRHMHAREGAKATGVAGIEKE